MYINIYIYALIEVVIEGFYTRSRLRPSLNFLVATLINQIYITYIQYESNID